MKARQGQAVVWPLLLASLAAMIGLGCVGFSALLGNDASQPTATPPAVPPTPTVPATTMPQQPFPTAAPQLVPEGAHLLAPQEFQAPVELLARWEDLPSGDSMMWWRPVEEEGLTRVGYVTFDGEVEDILLVRNEDAQVIGVGGAGENLVLREHSYVRPAQIYVVNLRTGDLWGYSPECERPAVGIAVGEEHLSYTCVEDDTRWSFISLETPHNVRSNDLSVERPMDPVWLQGDEIVFYDLFGTVCLARVSAWERKCVQYPWLGYINPGIDQVEVRQEDWLGGPLERVGFLSARCLWEGPEACEPVWFDTGLTRTVGLPGVWIPGGEEILLVEDDGGFGQNPDSLWRLNVRTGAVRFVGSYPSPSITVVHDRGVALVAPDGRVVVSRGLDEVHYLMSLEDGQLTHLIGTEGEELHLNGNGTLRVP